MPRGPFRVPLPSHLSPSGATEPLRSHSQSKVRTATHDGPGYCWVRLRLRRSALGLHACTTRPPWASNASEQALKDPRRHRAVSGYWHTAVTLAGYCRIRCSLTSVRGHGQRAIGAVHAALLGRPWLPAPGTA